MSSTLSTRQRKYDPRQSALGIQQEGTDMNTTERKQEARKKKVAWFDKVAREEEARQATIRAANRAKGKK